MLAILRRLVVSCVIAAGGVAFWEACDVRSYLASSPPDQPAAGVESSSSRHPSIWSTTSAGAGKRFLVWALFTLLTPIVTAPLASQILGRQSNAANVLLLFGYTGLDVLAAYLVNGIHVGGILAGVVYLVALLAVFSYNLWICAFLARLQQQ